VGEEGEFLRMTLAPDEKRAAVVGAASSFGIVNTWVMDLASGALTRMTFDPKQAEMDPVWSPDSKELLIRNAAGLARLTVATGAVESIPAPNAQFATDWSPDGKTIAVLDASLTKPFLLPLENGGQPRTLSETPFLKLDFHFSRDGNLVAYGSEESGNPEVYVATLPALADKQRVSTGGGSKPQWRADGKELFFIGADGSLMAADIAREPKLAAGAPKPLFQANLLRTVGAQYAVARDGKRFLLNQRANYTLAGSGVTIVLNWTADLKP
jgi:Tol biopolymer transport system component